MISVVDAVWNVTILMKNTGHYWYVLPFVFQPLFVCCVCFLLILVQVNSGSERDLLNTLNLKGYHHQISPLSVNALLNSVVTRIKDMSDNELNDSFSPLLLKWIYRSNKWELKFWYWGLGPFSATASLNTKCIVIPSFLCRFILYSCILIFYYVE